MNLKARLQATLGDQFTLSHEIGGGGMSRVFVATDHALGHSIVVKALPRELAHGVSVERFQHEIDVAERLHHPQIVPVLSSGEVDRLPYYTMPFVEGQSLGERLSHGDLPIPDVLRILRDVASALSYAHARGVIHRDIKPDNILLSGHSAAVMDFGVAKAVSTASTTDDPLTSTGIAFGTAAYMSPEQAAADPAVDHRTDIYAVGIVAYEMLTGAPPFVGRSAQQIFAGHRDDLPPSLLDLRADVPPSLAALVMRCLEKSPTDRYQTADELLRDLSVATMTPTPVQSVPTSDSPRRVAVRAAIVIAGVAAVAAFARSC